MKEDQHNQTGGLRDVKLSPPSSTSRGTIATDIGVVFPLRHIVTAVFASGLATLGAGQASCQTYPTRPLRIVTSDAGSGNDISARLIAQAISGPLGQQVIVDNRPGLSQEIVSKASPDGYTLLYVGSALWITPLISDSVSVFVFKDLAPIIWVTTSPTVLVVHPSLPVKSVRDLIALARARPGVLNYGSAGAGTTNYLAGELLKSMAGVHIVQVPYKGQGAAVNDLLGGHVQLMFSPAASVSTHIKAGKLRALAVTSAQRFALLPDFPTVAEAAPLPGYEAVSVTGMLAPARTPQTIIQHLNQEIGKALENLAVRQKFLSVGAQTVGGSSDQFAAKIKAEVSKWGKVIKESAIHGS